MEQIFFEPYRNESLTDAVGMPSEMVYIPAFRLSDVIDGASDRLHPAFVQGGRELRGIYVSKYQNVVRDGCAYSIRGVDPETGIDYDGADLAARNKGAGWHLTTAMEWGAIALLCLRNGHLPYGNNELGKDIRETGFTATVSYRDDEKGICRTATGTGPDAWSHSGTADGIYDLNGNVWEWSGGIRLVYGEVQLLADASADDASPSSDAWRAIDGRTGELCVPDGTGTTAHSVKLDYRDGKWIYVTGALTDALSKARFCDFADVSADEPISAEAKELLYALALLPWRQGSEFDGVALYANNGAAERIPFRGGRWGQGLNTGVFKTCIDDPRTYCGAAVGFRTSYCEGAER